VTVGKLDGKVAVITGGSTGMALAGAKLFVEEGAHVFIQARRQEALDDAALFTVQKALPLINDNGSILMTGSNASLGAFPGWSLYAGSKTVQQAWARTWLNELRDRRIRVNVLTPGQVATAQQEELFDEAAVAAFESLIPRGEMGRPEEIATVALFLASDDSSYVNGLELVADGGTTAL
jgi:NAD(P)-dependent dehydrogenase (short-subunit alcohol dehydrogenase family)